jgi:hypothetical protein
MGMENHGGMITGEISNFIHQSSLEILAAKSSSSKAGGTNEGNYEFCFRLQRVLRLYFPSEGMVWISVALKNLLSLAGFEPAKLGSKGKHTNH